MPTNGNIEQERNGSFLGGLNTIKSNENEITQNETNQRKDSEEQKEKKTQELPDINLNESKNFIEKSKVFG